MTLTYKAALRLTPTELRHELNRMTLSERLDLAVATATQLEAQVHGLADARLDGLEAELAFDEPSRVAALDLQARLQRSLR
jgi:hypothetical protein